ncbi:hypothetical protein RCL1_005308 [Eukaryota sp. TZLM3-RCL]
MQSETNPVDRAGFFSRLLFRYVGPLISLGYKRTLTPEDIVHPPQELKSTNLDENIGPNWQKELSSDSPSLYGALKSSYKKNLLITFVPHFFEEILSLLLPVFMNFFIGSYDNDPIFFNDRIVFGGALVLSVFLFGWFRSMFQISAARNAIRIKSGLISQLYSKFLSFSSSSLSTIGLGKTTNLISLDCEVLSFSVQQIFFLISAPIKIAVTVGMLFYFFGTTLFWALLVPLASLPVSFITTKRVMKNRLAYVAVADKRVKMTSEYLSGMKGIKLGAYEEQLKGKVVDKRHEEVGYIRAMTVLMSVLISVMTLQPVLMSIIVFMVPVIRGESLDAASVFTSLYLFNSISHPLQILSTVINRLAQAKVSLKRLQAVLLCEEIDELAAAVEVLSTTDDTLLLFDHASFDYKPVRPLTEAQKIDLEGKPPKSKKGSKHVVAPNEKTTPSADSRKSSEKLDFSLNSVSFCLNRGDFVALTGPVASGKSTFLLSLLGELRTIGGKVSRKKSIDFCYASQKPWLINASIKSNIILDHKFDQRIYKSVLDACALLPDLIQLVDGDATAIGERGVSLSGGQQARVSLARTIYSCVIKSIQGKSDIIVLLDDPLSAVDVKSAKHILSKTCTLLRQHNITLVLATHHMGLVKSFEKSQSNLKFRVLLLNDSTLQASGSFEELEDHPFLSQIISTHDSAEEEAQEVDTDKIVLDVDESNRRDSFVEPSTDSKPKGIATSEEDEAIHSGNVKFSVYKKYFSAMGGFWSIFFTILLFSSNQFFKLFADFSLSSFLDSDDQSARYFFISVAGNRLVFLVTSVLCFVVISLLLLKASITLHYKLITGVFSAPISFLERTPIGRIINRFSRDLGSIDSNLIMVFSFGLNTLFNVLSAIVLVSFVLPLFLVILPVVSIIFFLIANYYRRTSRQLSRLQSTLKSPVLATISESLSGLHVIRAGNLTPLYKSKFSEKLDQSTSSMFYVHSTTSWLGVRLQALCAFILAGVVALIIFSDLSAAFAGLVLTHSFQLLIFLSFLVQLAVEIEASMAAVERIVEYADLPSEILRPSGSDSLELNNWPENGNIELRNVSVRYRPECPLALDDLNLNIKAGEKLALIGRTGSGKSTTMLALFLLVRPESSSKIIVDGMDITTIPLSTLRSKMASIPQDPVLFSGTLRENIDIDGKLSSDEIIELLKQSQLGDYANEEGLQLQIEAGGGNLSIGEKQLVCLARALGRACKIVVIDEATSSTDFVTDQSIQTVLRSLPNSATIITIAHRLDTVLHYDRICVLEAGKVVEIGKPLELLNDSSSTFSQFVDEMGPSQAQRLRNLANELAVSS